MVMPETERRIGLGIIGWGGIARVHTLALRALPVLFPDLPFSVDLAAVATRNPERNRDAIRRSGFAAVMDSARALAADPAVDAVDISTPNALHPEQATAAWQAGKAVYCEKPLADNLAAARRMAEAWREAAGVEGKALPALSQVALVLRFLPAVARARDWIEEGRIGRVLAFRGRIAHGGYLDPARPISWRLDRALAGGGALADLGVHLIDLVLFLLGPVESVEARMRTFVTERPASAASASQRVKVEVDDWAEITCTLRSGSVGSIEATRAGDGQEETTLEIFGTEGSLRLGTTAVLFPQWFDRRWGDLYVRGGDATPGPYTRAAMSVWPPAKLSLGWMVDAHLASLHWWLRRLADPSGSAGFPAIAAGIEEGLAAQVVLEQAYTSAVLS